LPEPETAKYEEKVLIHTIRTIKAYIDFAILTADSLGKKPLLKRLEHLKYDADQLKP